MFLLWFKLQGQWQVPRSKGRDHRQGSSSENGIIGQPSGRPVTLVIHRWWVAPDALDSIVVDRIRTCLQVSRLYLKRRRPEREAVTDRNSVIHVRPRVFAVSPSSSLMFSRFVCHSLWDQCRQDWSTSTAARTTTVNPRLASMPPKYSNIAP